MDINSNKINQLLQMKKLYKIRISKKDDKKRTYAIPNPALKAFHREFNDLLQKLEKPAYLHSGYKGSSYINAVKVHQQSKLLVKVDIANFYQSTKKKYIKDFIITEFHCSEEHAEQLCSLLTYNGRIPTGSPCAMLLSFWAYKQVFDEIYDFAKEKGLLMTLFADDMTFSGDKFNPKEIISFTAKKLQSAGLRLNHHKIKVLRKKRVMMNIHVDKKNKLRISNSLGYSVIKILKTHKIEEFDEKTKQILLGKIAAVQQIEPQKFAFIKKLLTTTW